VFFFHLSPTKNPPPPPTLLLCDDLSCEDHDNRSYQQEIGGSVQ
jgi:hypothetical protein